MIITPLLIDYTISILTLGFSFVMGINRVLKLSANTTACRISSCFKSSFLLPRDLGAMLNLDYSIYKMVVLQVVKA